MAVDALGVCGSVGVCARAHIVWCALMCPSMLAFTVCVLPPACSLVSPSLRVLPTAPGRLKWDDWASFGNRNPLSQKQMPFYRVHFSVFCFFFPLSSECAFSCFSCQNFISLCQLSSLETAEVTVSSTAGQLLRLDSTELAKELRLLVSTVCRSVGMCEGSSQP